MRGRRHIRWTPDQWALVATVVLAAEVVFALAHLAVTGGRYSTSTPGHGVVIDLGLASIWGTAIVAVWVRRTVLLFLFLFAAVMTSLLHGVLFSLAIEKAVGIPFMLAAAVLAFAMRRLAHEWHVDTPWHVWRHGERGSRA